MVLCIICFAVIAAAGLAGNVYFCFKDGEIAWWYVIYSLLHIAVAAALFLPPWGMYCKFFA